MPESRDRSQRCNSLIAWCIGAPALPSDTCQGFAILRSNLKSRGDDDIAKAVAYGRRVKCIYTREQIGTRYVIMAVRTLIDPASPKDLEEVHKLQDAIQVEQKSPGKYEVPNWDPASPKMVRDALLVLGSTLPDSKRMFGRKDQVDPVRHLIGTAMAWGVNPEKDAIYLNVTPSQDDGKTVYRFSIKAVPVMWK